MLREELQKVRKTQKIQGDSDQRLKEKDGEIASLQQQLQEVRISDAEKQDTIRQIREISKSTSAQLNDKLKELQNLQEIVHNLQVPSFFHADSPVLVMVFWDTPLRLMHCFSRACACVSVVLVAVLLCCAGCVSLETESPRRGRGPGKECPEGTAGGIKISAGLVS